MIWVGALSGGVGGYNPTSASGVIVAGYAISPAAGDTGFAQVFEGWRHDHFTAAEQQNPAISALAADPEGDGLNNAMEYAFGGDPRVTGP